MHAVYGRMHGYHLHWRPDRKALDVLLKDQIHDDYGSVQEDLIKLPRSCHAYHNTEFPGEAINNGSAYFQVRIILMLERWACLPKVMFYRTYQICGLWRFCLASIMFPCL